jgi:gas vesicle protein
MSREYERYRLEASGKFVTIVRRAGSAVATFSAARSRRAANLVLKANHSSFIFSRELPEQVGMYSVEAPLNWFATALIRPANINWRTFMNEDTTSRMPDGTSGRSERDRSKQGGGAKAAVDDATAAFGDVRERVVDAAHEVGDRAKEAAQTARDRAEELADQGKSAGADQMKGFAQAARGAAENLEEQSPEIARYVRQAADGLEQAADTVRNKSVGDFIDMVQDFARRQPAAFFGSTVLAGFVLSRFVKSRSDRSTGTGSPDQTRWQRGADDAFSESPARETATTTRPDLPTMPSTIGELPS